MANQYQAQIDDFMANVKAKNGHESEFLQAVEEVAETVIPFIEKNLSIKKRRFWKE